MQHMLKVYFHSKTPNQKLLSSPAGRQAHAFVGPPLEISPRPRLREVRYL